MKKCPKCSRYNIEYDPVIGSERCLWKDCGWVKKNNEDDEDSEIDKHTYNFSKFKKYLEIKISQT